MNANEDQYPDSDRVTPLGYWYHRCPVTGETRRIGRNYKVVVGGKCPPYKRCYLCGAPNPAAKDSLILKIQESCSHKFVDSPRCLKCGWSPSDG